MPKLVSNFISKFHHIFLMTEGNFIYKYAIDIVPVGSTERFLCHTETKESTKDMDYMIRYDSTKYSLDNIMGIFQQYFNKKYKLYTREERMVFNQINIKFKTNEIESDGFAHVSIDLFFTQSINYIYDWHRNFIFKNNEIQHPNGTKITIMHHLLKGYGYNLKHRMYLHQFKLNDTATNDDINSILLSHGYTPIDISNYINSDNILTNLCIFPNNVLQLILRNYFKEVEYQGDYLTIISNIFKRPIYYDDINTTDKLLYLLVNNENSLKLCSNWKDDLRSHLFNNNVDIKFSNYER